MVNKIFTAMFLISVVAFAPAAAWAHTGHHHHPPPPPQPSSRVIPGDKR